MVFKKKIFAGFLIHLGEKVNNTLNNTNSALLIVYELPVDKPSF